MFTENHLAFFFFYNQDHPQYLLPPLSVEDRGATPRRRFGRRRSSRPWHAAQLRHPAPSSSPWPLSPSRWPLACLPRRTACPAARFKPPTSKTHSATPGFASPSSLLSPREPHAYPSPPLAINSPVGLYLRHTPPPSSINSDEPLLAYGATTPRPPLLQFNP